MSLKGFFRVSLGRRYGIVRMSFELHLSVVMVSLAFLVVILLSSDQKFAKSKNKKAQMDIQAQSYYFLIFLT